MNKNKKYRNKISFFAFLGFSLFGIVDKFCDKGRFSFHPVSILGILHYNTEVMGNILCKNNTEFFCQHNCDASLFCFRL